MSSGDKQTHGAAIQHTNVVTKESKEDCSCDTHESHIKCDDDCGCEVRTEEWKEKAKKRVDKIMSYKKKGC